MDDPSTQAPEPRDSTQYVTQSWWQQFWKRSMVWAHGSTQKDLHDEEVQAEMNPMRKAWAYLKIRFILWIWHYLRSRIGRKWQFQDYTDYPDDNGIYPLVIGPDDPNATAPVRVSLIGDWGSGTHEAHEVAECVERDQPHFTIHLGDIYYVGTKYEIQQNMLGGKTRWPLGLRGSFALNANHEMYARGKAYFKHLLPALGMRTGQLGTPQKQKASFFALQNDHWLIIGLDTGYNSVGTPIIEKFWGADSRLPEQLMTWLRDDVRLQDDHQRGVILLSHHQYYSQFESGHDAPAKQIAELINRPVLWFWGHEHRMALYGKHTSQKAGLAAYGRCLGHGGLPIEDIEGKPRREDKYQVGLVLYDRRERTAIGPFRTPVGYNGYANLLFDDRQLMVEYKDTEQALVRENWEVDDHGMLVGKSIVRLVDHHDLVVHAGASLADAIQ